MAVEVRRKRLRKDSISVDRAKMAERVSDFYETDRTDRDDDLENRLQRYAKYRMWTEGADGPWEDSSDVAISDMMEKSLRMQDTLNNAVMSQRPAIVSQAMHRPNANKETLVDNLLDYQFFEEAPGEITLGDLADQFINDGVFTVFIPWVKEVRRQSDVRVLPEGIPADMFPPDFFMGILTAMFTQEAVITPKGNRDQPWDFTVEIPLKDGADKKPKIEVGFYTREDGRAEMVLVGDVVVYDAPLPRALPYDDVFHPVRCANLQPPGPSNPRGAAHVLIRDYPTKDEIVRLQRSGFYDLMTKKEVEALPGYQRTHGSDDREEQQKDDLAGKNENTKTAGKVNAKSHDTLTRLICFDRYDVNGDGLDEDVMWWYLVEPDIIVKAKVLQEMYPTLRPDHPRPFAEASLFPVPGRRVGISYLEMLEGIHDMMKVLFDQTIDGNTMGIVPFGFYRPTSSMQSERIRLAPGDLYPLQDPSRDVSFPQIGNGQAQSVAINLISMLQQMEERVSVIGDFQLGRVPAGRATALRTVGAINALSGQGEARPERILRRFFSGIAEIFRVMHDLNQYFLPKRKQIRIQGIAKPGQDPYVDIDDATAVKGHFKFTFKANAFNTSKAQLQQTMQTLLGTFVNQMAMQMGVTDPETVYNMLRDFSMALGVDPVERGYIKPPRAGLNLPTLFAEEAMLLIMQGQAPPMSRPGEPGSWGEHLQKLLGFEDMLVDEKTDTGEITPEIAQLFQGYKATVAQRAQEEQQQMQMAQAAEQFGQQQGGQGTPTGRPTEQAPPDPNANPQISGANEMLDETLPSARGVAA